MFTVPSKIELNQAAMQMRSNLFPKGKEDQPIERQIRGTVVELYEDGKGLQPTRLMMQLDTGEHVMLTCRDALEVDQGDDMIVRGTLHPSSDPKLPPEMIVEDGANPHTRLRKVVQGGAEAKSFGQGDVTVNDRPGLHAGVYGAADIPTHFTPRGSSGGGRSNVTIIKAATHSDDPTIKWVSKLFEGIPTRGNVNIVNPFAFLPKQPVGSLRLGWGQNPAQMIFGQAAESQSVKRKLEDKLPLNLRRELPSQIAPVVLMSLPMYMRMIERGPDHRKSDRGVLVPFNPWDSYTTLLGYTVSISPNMIAPKYIVPASVRFPHIAAHEMAHSVQDQYGVEMKMGSLAATNKAECFADSFAVLAGMQRAHSLGDQSATEEAIKGIRMIGQGRHAFLLKGGLTHATGHAYSIAIAKAEELQKAGKLAGMSTHQLLQEAGKIAAEHSFDGPALSKIERLRQAAYKANGLKAMGNMLRDEAGGFGAYKAIKAALAKGPGGFDGDQRMFKLFKDAAEGLETVAYLPDELKQDATANMAARLYQQDLEDTLGYARGTEAQRRILFELERLQHADKQQTLADRMNAISGKAKPPGIEAKRREVLKRMGAQPVKARKATEEQVHVTTIRRHPADQGLKDAFGSHPQDRLSLYLTTLSEERDAVVDAQGHQGAPHERADAWRKVYAKSQKRHLLAWAIQSTADSREFLDQIGNDDLKAMIASEAINDPDQINSAHADEIKRKLDDRIGLLQADPAIAPLIDPDPPMDIDDLFTREDPDAPDSGPSIFGLTAARAKKIETFQLAHSQRPTPANTPGARLTDLPRAARRRRIKVARL